MFFSETLKKFSGPAALVPLLIGLTAGLSYASLDTLDFSYDTTGAGPVLSGTMTGTLLADNNTFTVTSIGPLTFGGSPAPSVPLLLSLDNIFGLNSAAVPTVTLNGSFIDLLACIDVVCSDGFAFAVGSQFTGATGGDAYDSIGPAFGGNGFVPFLADGWHASIAVATPEPGYAWPILAAAGLTFFIRRSKRTTSALPERP